MCKCKSIRRQLGTCCAPCSAGRPRDRRLNKGVVSHLPNSPERSVRACEQSAAPEKRTASKCSIEYGHRRLKRPQVGTRRRLGTLPTDGTLTRTQYRSADGKCVAGTKIPGLKSRLRACGPRSPPTRTGLSLCGCVVFIGASVWGGGWVQRFTWRSWPTVTEADTSRCAE